MASFPSIGLGNFPNPPMGKTLPNMKSCQRQEENNSQTDNLLKEVENYSLAWENSLTTTCENF